MHINHEKDIRFERVSSSAPLPDDFTYEDEEKSMLFDWYNAFAYEIDSENEARVMKIIFEPQNKVIGYFSHSLKPIKQQKLAKVGIASSTVSCGVLYLERILIDKNFRGKMIGKYTLYFLKSIASNILKQTAIRGITTDSRPKTTGFYEDSGFMKVGGINQERQTYLMLLPIAEA